MIHFFFRRSFFRTTGRKNDLRRMSNLASAYVLLNAISRRTQPKTALSIIPDLVPGGHPVGGLADHLEWLDQLDAVAAEEARGGIDGA